MKARKGPPLSREGTQGTLGRFHKRLRGWQGETPSFVLFPHSPEDRATHSGESQKGQLMFRGRYVPSGRQSLSHEVVSPPTLEVTHSRESQKGQIMFRGRYVPSGRQSLSHEVVSPPTLEVTKHCLDTCLPGMLPAEEILQP